MSRTLLAVALCLVAIPAFGGGIESITVTPARPTVDDDVTLILTGWWSTPCEQGEGAPGVSRSGSAIRIVVPVKAPVPGTACATVIVPFSFSIRMGKLLSERYQIQGSVGTIGDIAIKDFDVAQFPNLDSLTISPVHPQTTDEISLTISGSYSTVACDEVPRVLPLSRSGFTITVQVPTYVTCGVYVRAQPWTFTVAIGKLAAGQYNVRVSGRSTLFTSFAVGDGNSPVQSGYAVVTPASDSMTGLVAFETLGLWRGSEVSQADVFPPGLTNKAVIFAQSSSDLSHGLGVSVLNPGASTATVTMALHKNDGSQVDTASLNVPSHQQISKFVSEMFTNVSVATSVTGTLVVTSTVPVSIIGLRFRGMSFSTLPATNLSPAFPVPVVATGIGGPGAILLPQFVTGGGWDTEIVLVNTSTSNLTLRVDLFKSDGTPMSSFENLKLQAGGVLTLPPPPLN